MTKIEIIVLIITIFVSVTLLSFFLDKVFKIKVEKKEKKEEKKQEKHQEEVKEPVKEEVKEEKVEEKKQKASKSPPQISLALQDELNEFKNYLKARITPEIVSEDEKIKHSYDLPKLNRFDDFDFPKSDNMPEFPFKRQTTKESAYKELPDDVKILLFTNFFDTKF